MWVTSPERIYTQVSLSKIKNESNGVGRYLQNRCSEKNSETAVRRCSTKTVFLDISQTSRKKPVLESFFKAVERLRYATVLKT